MCIRDRAHAAFLNVLEKESIKKLIDQTVQIYGKLDIIHNNVGGTNPQLDLDIVNMDEEEWHRGFQLNIDSVMYGCRYAIPYMQKNGGGSIINTLSLIHIFYYSASIILHKQAYFDINFRQ